jgi:hypothetical protein
VLLNLTVLPIVGAVAARSLDAGTVGRPGAPFASTATAAGQGTYRPGEGPIRLEGTWSVFSRDDLGRGAEADYAVSSTPGSSVSLAFYGRRVQVRYGTGPDHGAWAVLVDGEPVLADGEPLLVDGFNPAPRFGERVIIDAGAPGEHLLTLVNTGTGDARSTGTAITIGSLEVLEPSRESRLGTVLGLLLLVQAGFAAVARIAGPMLLRRVAAEMTTKRTILLALALYSVIAVWGFFLDTVIEFWFIAWMVAVVQGGSQALSRSLYASMSPASMSGEFFGFFSVMEKVSAILGPILFGGAVLLFGSSRPAVLGIVLLFLAGGVLLARVDVDEGRRVAAEADRTGPA